MKAILFAGLFISSVAITGCGDKHFGPDGVNDTDNSLSYSANENGCDTGNHVFATRAEYCAALEDGELNHHCAVESRREYFDQYCQGFQWHSDDDGGWQGRR